ncbi:hypothetical protein BV22DRAFT_1052626 [Leucogyrophana mollusca]|uniref:Uncharacterized protein n=1 Tax=Leucogyrophana mollusca TaxID=85980 RepID=A0ACB8AW35_9AGAM|nr:hypothetical protein BV22DRAFT_1052626 [Leucogyrophana mollusca]
MGANENIEEAMEGAPRKEKEADASVRATGTEGQTATLESPNVSHEKTCDVAKGTPRVLPNAKEASKHMLVDKMSPLGNRANQPPSDSDEEEQVPTNEEGLEDLYAKESLTIAREDRAEIPRTTREVEDCHKGSRIQRDNLGQEDLSPKDTQPTSRVGTAT